jgi:hypothetical protein
MKALFVAPDLSVIASIVSDSDSAKEFLDKAGEYTEENYKNKTKSIHSSPAYRRYTWVKFEKTENDIDFFSNIAMLSANNSYTATEKDIIMTQDSVFINLNILDAFREIAKSSGGEEIEMDLDMENRMSFDSFNEIAKNMFEDGKAKFHELTSTDNGPQLFMLTGEFTNDTWSILESIGVVARKNVVMQKEHSVDKEWPGICLLFGLSMNALAQIAQTSDGFPEHIRNDFMKLPRVEENESN